MQKLLALIVLVVLAVGCNEGTKQDEAGQRIYTIREVVPIDQTLVECFPVVLKGKLDVEIRPQVGGQIIRLAVDEGKQVKRGELLFVIDPVQFQEAVNVAQAAVEVARTGVATAELTAANNRQLAHEKIIGATALQTSENALASAKARLAQAEAQLTSAKKQLSFTRIVSPTDGVVGSIPFRVGSLVSPSTPTPLTIISDISQMYAHFSITEHQLLA